MSCGSFTMAAGSATTELAPKSKLALKSQDVTQASMHSVSLRDLPVAPEVGPRILKFELQIPGGIRLPDKKNYQIGEVPVLQMLRAGVNPQRGADAPTANRSSDTPHSRGRLG